jgi:hypothetical protein
LPATEQIDGSGRDCRVPGVTERAPMSTWGAAPEVPVDGVAGEPLLRPDDYAA